MRLLPLVHGLLGAAVVLANVEKTIFLGPEPIPIPAQHPTLSDLRLDILTPASSSVRRRLEAAFPTDAAKHGKEAWLLLANLVKGQRYEVRVCWAATQPTAFRLDTFELTHVFETPELVTSLAAYSYAQPDAVYPSAPTGDTSLLFLRIHTAADYYSANKTLMQNVPPVHVDIILDPFLLNVLPRSLGPTAAYIVLVAACAWLVARRIASWLQVVADTGPDGSASDPDNIDKKTK